jgi:hypothetical protein
VPVGDVAQEAARGPAVADPVVEGQRQLGHLADGQLPADSPGPVDDPAQAEDRHLRVADPNGMAPDDRDGFIYVADSPLSVIWRVSIADGTVSAWARGPQLAPDGGLGANGLKLHDGAVWVSNTQLGTLLRVPIGLTAPSARSRRSPPAWPASTTSPSPGPDPARRS